jgi:hypothetical protein
MWTKKRTAEKKNAILTDNNRARNQAREARDKTEMSIYPNYVRI